MRKRLAIIALFLSLMLVATACNSGKEESGGTNGGSTQEKASAPRIDIKKTPAENFKARDAKLEPASSEKVHKITMIATEEKLEIAPGVKQEMWVFNGMAPGPVLRGKIGDRFEVTIKNEGKIGHSMDFHASYAPWNTQMKTINPGESIDYFFTAEKAGIYMYHCGTSPALHHIGNGMWGALVVDPPDLAPVDHEFIFLQGELYAGKKEGPGDINDMLADKWDAVVFNGVANQYLHRPIRVEPNQRIRAWVLDGGPSENSSFHVVGTIFDTVYKEGTYTLKPGPGGSQALDLQPAQGGFVEFTLKDPGLYPIVTHKFSNASKGALGLFQAGEVTTMPAGGH